jgi:hypothetical protein
MSSPLSPSDSFIIGSTTAPALQTPESFPPTSLFSALQVRWAAVAAVGPTQARRLALWWACCCRWPWLWLRGCSCCGGGGGRAPRRWCRRPAREVSPSLLSQIYASNARFGSIQVYIVSTQVFDDLAFDGPELLCSHGHVQHLKQAHAVDQTITSGSQRCKERCGALEACFIRGDLVGFFSVSARFDTV